MATKDQKTAPRAEGQMPSIAVRLPKELYDQIHQLAIEDDRSVGYVARQLIALGLSAKTGKKA